MKTIWDKYHYDRQIIDEFLECFTIKIEGYNEPIHWKNTLSKILVWDGFNMDLKHDYSTVIKNRKSSYIKSLAKWILHRKEANSSFQKFPNQLLHCEYLFFLKNKGELEILIPILSQLKSKANFQIVYENADTSADYKPWELIKFSTLPLKPQTIGFIPNKIPHKKALFVFNSFLREKEAIEKYVSFFQTLKEKNHFLKKIIFVAGENKYVANLCHQIFLQTSVKTENLMNGAKYGWPNDADIDFDTWYVWNKKMKAFLVNNANVLDLKLKVVGHPLEEQTKHHSYTESILDLNAFRNNCKEVITLFTTSLRFEKKLPIYEMIIQFVIKQPSIGLIVKAHQSDRDVAIFKNYKSNPQVLYFDGFSKELLLDIISSSQLTISFGSTVSFESVWMGVPNISYEEEPETLLPIDDELFFHINSTEELVPKIKAMLKNNIHSEPKDSNESVVEKYVESILN